ncbi:MAG TPA: type II toxin-antitoxin system RelE/ParE family toxin [Oscillatoriaceae cyanobacterium]
MVRTFIDPRAERLFQRDAIADLPHEVAAIALRKLAMLHSAVKLADLRDAPGNRLSTLAGGSHKGHHTIEVAGDWRLCFKWMDGDAYRVELVSDREGGCHG